MGDSRMTDAQKAKRPKCPRCGRHLVKFSKTPTGKQRWGCYGLERSDNNNAYCYSTTNPDSPIERKRSGAAANPVRFARKLGAAVYVVTCAQNATGIHEGFFKALLTYCKVRKAELIVIPIRYKNPTSIWTASQANEEIWAPELAPYLYNQRKKLGPNIVLLGDVKTRPTASSPLESFEGLTHGESCILGHTKVQLKTVATPQSKWPKILTTTGAVTKLNYTDSKSGKLGEFHHTFGAVVVETVGKMFHLRQISATKDGSFTDLDRDYLPDGTTTLALPAEALVLGDLHYRVMDPEVIKATFGGKGSIVGVTDPGTIVFHDLLDGMSRNPWHRDDPFAELAKRPTGLHNVRAEIRETIEWASKVTRDRKAVIVPSNHDAFLVRWVLNADWKKDPDNAEFYLETALQMLRDTSMTPSGHKTIDPFIHWVRKLAGSHVRAPEMDESILLGGVECGLHGHLGPNGARGSVKNLSRLGVRVTSGHGHSPAIEEGHHRVGTSSHLRLEYNRGPSSWLNTHGLIYANGKRTLLNVINGQWRA